MSISLPSREDGVSFNVIQGVVIGVVLTALSYFVGVHFGWIDSVNLLEAFAVFTSYVCTYLCVMERRINYPIGAVSTAAYCVLFLQASLLASMAINAFLAVYLIYGWYRWKTDDVTRPVTRMSIPNWLIYVLVAALGYGIIVGLAMAFGGALAWTDSVIFAGTILAQFMLDNKKLENWWIWLIVNIFAIYTYATAGLALVAFQYVFFAANTVYGYYMWRNAAGVKAANNYRDKMVAPLALSAEDENKIAALLKEA